MCRRCICALTQSHTQRAYKQRLSPQEVMPEPECKAIASICDTACLPRAGSRGLLKSQDTAVTWLTLRLPVVGSLTSLSLALRLLSLNKWKAILAGTFRSGVLRWLFLDGLAAFCCWTAGCCCTGAGAGAGGLSMQRFTCASSIRPALKCLLQIGHCARPEVEAGGLEAAVAALTDCTGAAGTGSSGLVRRWRFLGDCALPSWLLDAAVLPFCLLLRSCRLLLGGVSAGPSWLSRLPCRSDFLISLP